MTTAGAEDYVDADPFDPEIQRQAEVAEASALQSVSAEVREFINKRKNAYSAVFAGNASTGDVAFVMADLARFCRAYEPTFHPTNQKIQDLQEGRREVYQRIVAFTRLSHEALYVKYITDAQRG